MSVWAEKPPSLEDILANVSLYWLTGCFPTSIWIYREVRVPDEHHHGIEEGFLYNRFTQYDEVVPRGSAMTVRLTEVNPGTEHADLHAQEHCRNLEPRRGQDTLWVFAFPLRDCRTAQELGRGHWESFLLQEP